MLLAFAALVYRAEGHVVALSQFEGTDADDLSEPVTMPESQVGLQGITTILRPWVESARAATEISLMQMSRILRQSHCP